MIDGGIGARRVEADANGVAVIDRIPYDGSTTVSVVGIFHSIDGATGEAQATEAPIRVTGPSMMVRLPALIRLSVEAVSRETLHAVPTRVTALGGGFESDGGKAALLWVRNGVVSGSIRCEPWDSALAPTTELLAAWVSPDADQLRAVICVSREAPLVVDALSQGIIARDLALWRVTVDGKAVPGCSTESDGRGRWHIRGAPFVPRGLVQIEAFTPSDGATTAPGRMTVVLGDRVSDDILLEWKSVVRGTGTGIDGMWQNPVEERERVFEMPKALLRKWTPRGVTTVKSSGQTIRVMRRSGEPAGGVFVRVGDHAFLTDGAGEVGIPTTERERRTVSAWQVGLCTVTRELDPGVVAPFTLEECEFRTIRVVVVDAKGVRVPFADVHIEQEALDPWIDVDGRIQRIDSVVDAEGSRVFHGIHPSAGLCRATAGVAAGEAAFNADVPAGGGEVAVKITVQ